MTINNTGNMMTNPAQHIPVGSARGPRDGSGPRGQQIARQQQTDQAQQHTQQQKMMQNRLQQNRQSELQQQVQQQDQQRLAAMATGIGANLDLMA
jgi:hypothetical protein